MHVQADYDAVFQPDATLASTVLESAKRFIDLCRTEFRLDAIDAAEEKRRPS